MSSPTASAAKVDIAVIPKKFRFMISARIYIAIGERVLGTTTQPEHAHLTPHGAPGPRLPFALQSI
jgi:hypothetical protein